MFKNAIQSTPFTTSDANAYFTNIQGNAIFGDHSFLATLRALVAPRIPNDENIKLKIVSNTLTAKNISEMATVSSVEYLTNFMFDNGYGFLSINNLIQKEEDSVACLTLLERKFCQVYPSFIRLENITAFYRKAFRVLCFVDPGRKGVCVFIDRMDTRKYHYLQCSILAMLPWYFDQKAGISEKEMELIQSLREPTSDHYQQVLKEIAAQYDFATARIRNLLNGFELRYEREAISRTQAEISDIDSIINDLNRRISDRLEERNEKLIYLSGLEAKVSDPDKSDSELMDYFLCNKSVNLINCTGNLLVFAVKDYILYFDPDMAERLINNACSYVYDGLPRDIKKDSAIKLMQEIFLSDDPRLKIKTCAAFHLDIGGGVLGVQGFSFDASFDDAIPNMHIQGYSCLGNYNTVINDLMRNRDYIGAIEQCVASTKSLNFADSIVMREFANVFWRNARYNNRCIELPDGKVVRPVDAISWLEAQEVPNDEQEKEETENE